MTQHDDKTPMGVTKQAHKDEATKDLEIVDASNLFGSSREIGIRHDGALYRLKITRQGKLILNK